MSWIRVDNGGMSATLPAELRRELARLRERAYGPDADIGVDPDAARRLAELEELARPAADAAATPLSEAGASPSSGAQPPAAVGRDRDPLTDSARSAEDDGDAGAPEVSEQEETFRRAPWWKDARLIVTAVAAFVVGVVGGVALPALNTPQPDYTAAIDPDAPVDPTEAWIQQAQRVLDVVPGSLRQHDQVEGVTMWTGENTVGSRCMIVAWGELWGNGGCTPEGLDPIVDFRADLDIPMPLASTLAEGGIVRFIARGDVVEIWIREPAAESSAQTG